MTADRRHPPKLAVPDSHLQRTPTLGGGSSGGPGSFTSLLVSLGASIASDLTVGGNTTLGGTLAVGGLTYTWPASQANHRVLHTNGSGTLSWGQVDLTSEITGIIPSGNVSGAYSGITGVGTLASGAVPASLVTAGTFGAGAYTFPSTLLVTTNLTASGVLHRFGDGTSSATVLINGAAAQDRLLSFYTNSVARWQIVANSAAESGSDAGTNFVLRAYTDAGVLIDNVIVVTRAAAGAMTVARPLSLSSTLSVTGGTTTFGTSATQRDAQFNGPAGSSRRILFLTAGSARWIIDANVDAESGSNAGTSFRINARDDSGNSIDLPVVITRAAGGSIALVRPLTTTRQITSTLATGTAPFVVASTTLVANLHADNSDKLGGTVAASYALLASPTFTGTPAAPTAAPGTNTTQLATTAFVTAAAAALVTGVSSVFGRTGAVVAVAGDYGPTLGGTGQTSWTLGDLLYGSGVNTLAKLAGQITTTKKYLQQVGSGAASAAPSWAQVDFADLSGTASNAQISGSYTNITGVGTLAAGAVPLSLVTAGTSGSGTFTFPTLAASTRLTAPLIGTTTAVDVVLDRNSVTQLTLASLVATFAGTVKGKRYFGTGTSHVAGDYALSAGWGTTATVSALVAKDTGGTVVVTCSGSSIASNPTVTLTFKDGTWTNIPSVVVCRSDLTSPTSGVWSMSSISATQAVFRFVGLPVASTTYQFNFIVMGL